MGITGKFRAILIGDHVKSMILVLHQANDGYITKLAAFHRHALSERKQESAKKKGAYLGIDSP